MIAYKKLWKMFFISFKKLFPFSRYSDFSISVFPFFPIASHCFRGWSKMNLKVYNIMICPNKNLLTHFVWYLEKEKRNDIETLSIKRVLNKEYFYGKVIQKTGLNKLRAQWWACVQRAQKEVFVCTKLRACKSFKTLLSDTQILLKVVSFYLSKSK